MATGSDDVLRMVAVIVDGWSKPLRELQEAFRKAQGQGQTMHRAGSAETRKHSEAYDALLQTARQLQGDLEPVVSNVANAANLARLGFGGLTASVIGLVGAGAGLAYMFQNTSHHLLTMGRATDLTANQLRQFEALGERVGSSTEAMDTGLMTLSTHMDTLRRVPQAEQNLMWTAGFRPDLIAQVMQIRNLTRPEQIQKLFEIGNRIGDIDIKRRFFEYFFGGTGDALAVYSLDELRRMMLQINANLRPLTQEQIEQGERAKQAWQSLMERMGSFKDFLGATFLPGLVESYDRIEAFAKNVRNEIGALSGYLGEITSTAVKGGGNVGDAFR
jgi:hypothetical protein